jgi:transcriptional regulator GlxA family with amidase domain
MIVGILLFDEVEELDFVGPWEVFGGLGKAGKGVEVVSVAETTDPVRCANGLRVIPDHDFGSAPALDIVLVPGGMGTRHQIENPVLIDWLRDAGSHCRWVTSVCTGSQLLHGAGFTSGRRITTHWGFVETLREQAKDATVLDDVRYVADGNLVTAAGVSAGIDMALWLVGQIWDEDLSRSVAHYMQYDPEPPYAQVAE